MGTWLLRLTLLLAFASALYGLVALGATLTFLLRLRKAPPSRDLPPVSILKPLCGWEPELDENLVSFCHQDYPAPFQLVFGVASADDPAVASVERLRRRFPGLDIRLSTQARLLGTNPKVNNLAGMLPLASHSVLVISDADVRVTPDYLSAVVSPLVREGAGAVTCLYRGRAADGHVGSRLLAAYINGWFLPSVLVGLLGRRSAYGLGATLALRRETLAAIGGLPSIADALADDFRLARRVESTGRRVALAPILVQTSTSEPTLAAFLRHLLRWVRTTRASRPWGFAFSFLTYPVGLSALACLLAGARLSLLLLLVLAALLRGALLALGSGHASLSFLLLVPCLEVVALAVWAVAFTGRRVRWRDEDYTVDAAGRLKPADQTSPLGGVRARAR